MTKTRGRGFRADKALCIMASLALASGLASASALCDWWQPTTWGACILEEVYGTLFGMILGSFYKALAGLILINPDITVVNPMFQAYMNILQPIFTFSLVCLAFYLLFVSGSPAGRARAKDMFGKLMLAMVAVSLSPEIFQILMEIAYALSLKMLATAIGGVDMSALMAAQFMIIGIALLPVFFIILCFCIASMILRALGVLILASIFPLTLFFYIFQPPLIGGLTKNISFKLWRWTLAFIFAQPVQALMLAITAIGFNGIPEVDFWANILSFYIGIAGLVMVALAPLMMMQILSWIGGGLMGMGMYLTLAKGNLVGGAMASAAGGVMLGSGPGSLMAAGGTAGMGFAQKMGGYAQEGRLDMSRKYKERPKGDRNG